jgi:hypothetical protein
VYSSLAAFFHLRIYYEAWLSGGIAQVDGENWVIFGLHSLFLQSGTLVATR